jgi:hypothetical protein
MVHTIGMMTTILIITLLGIGLISLLGSKPPTPEPEPTPDDFDVLIDEYMIYDPDLDGKI